MSRSRSFSSEASPPRDRERRDRYTSRRRHDSREIYVPDNSRVSRKGSGTVTNINPKGFGFIKNFDGDDIFFHGSALKDLHIDDLHKGDTIKYEAKEEKGKRTLRAIWVKLAGEPRREGRARESERDRDYGRVERVRYHDRRGGYSRSPPPKRRDDYSPRRSRGRDDRGGRSRRY